MSRTVRTWLLAGCCAIALLEARRAGESLSAGLSGPYAAETPANDLRAELEAPAPVSSAAPILLFGPAHAPIAGWLGRGRR
jgi:hypothetical protein